jgi:hypothetical protein
MIQFQSALKSAIGSENLPSPRYVIDRFLSIKYFRPTSNAIALFCAIFCIFSPRTSHVSPVVVFTRYNFPSDVETRENTAVVGVVTPCGVAHPTTPVATNSDASKVFTGVLREMAFFTLDPV